MLPLFHQDHNLLGFSLSLQPCLQIGLVLFLQSGKFTLVSLLLIYVVEVFLLVFLCLLKTIEQLP